MKILRWIWILPGFAALEADVPEDMRETRVINFEEPAGMGYVQHGYRITGPGSRRVRVGEREGISAANGTRILTLGRDDAPLTLAHGDGLGFDLLSIQLAEYSTVALPDSVRFRGTLVDGREIEFQTGLDGVIDGEGPEKDFEKVVFPSNWRDLVRVEVLDGTIAVDDIEVRGLGLESIDAAYAPTVSLEKLAIVEESESYNTWSVEDYRSGYLILKRQRYRYDPEFRYRFDLHSRQITGSANRSADAGENIETGERARVARGALMWSKGDEAVELARVGEDDVSRIRYPRPGGGRVLFVNPWYEDQEQYVVFLAGPEGVEPVVTPETLLPDEGYPHSFPDDLYFDGASFAVPTSTTESDDLFIMSFDGGPLVLSPSEGDAIPGTDAVLAGEPRMAGLEKDSARFEGTTTDGDLVRIVMYPDGSWSGEVISVPAGFPAKTVIPGAGLVQRHSESSISGDAGYLVSYGPLECSDVAPNNLYGLTVRTPEDSHHAMIREGQEIDGFGRVDRVYRGALVHAGWFYATARSADGNVALFRARVPRAEPRARIEGFASTDDGSVRLMAGRLTHGKRYRIEASTNLSGDWTRAAAFTAGATRRSVFGQFQKTERSFFRLVEEE